MIPGSRRCGRCRRRRRRGRRRRRERRRCREPVRGGLDQSEPVIAPALREVARELLSNRAFIFLALGYTAQIFLQNAVEFWLPTILQEHGVSDTKEIGLYSALPYLFAMILMVLLGLDSIRESTFLFRGPHTLEP